MNKIEEYLNMERINELLGKKEAKKESHPVICIFAILGAIAAIAGIAFMIYRYFSPKYLVDFEDDFDDDFDDDFFDEEEDDEEDK